MGEKTLEAFQAGMMGISSDGHRLVSQWDPKHFEALKGWYPDATVERGDGVLPRKVKELIIMSLCTFAAQFRGTKVHMQRALLLGASPREVLEALEAAAVPGGLPILWRGAEILAQNLEELGRKFE